MGYFGSVENYPDHLRDSNGPPESMFVVILKLLLWSDHTDAVIVTRVRNLVTAYDKIK